MCKLYFRFHFQRCTMLRPIFVGLILTVLTVLFPMPKGPYKKYLHRHRSKTNAQEVPYSTFYRIRREESNTLRRLSEGEDNNVHTAAAIVSTLSKGEEDDMVLLKILEVGLSLLKRTHTGKMEEDLFAMIQHWKLCMCAVKNSYIETMRNNTVCKYIVETREHYWKLFNEHSIEVHIIRRLDEVCRKVDYIPLTMLFLSFECWQKDSLVVKNVKSYVQKLDKTNEEVKCVVNVLQIMSESLNPDKIQGLPKVIKFVEGRKKDLEIGLGITIQHIVDQSFFSFCLPLLSLCQMNQYLWKSKIFLKIFAASDVFSSESKLEGDDDILVNALCKIMESTRKSYQDYWKMVCTDQSISVSDLHIVSGKYLENEVNIAEEAMGEEVPASVKDALQLAGDYHEYIEKTHIIKQAFAVLSMDEDEDTQFKNAVSAFTAIKTQQDSLTLKNLVNASMTFKQIDLMLDPSTVDILKEFSKSKSLLEFIKEIQHEDLRNLIDAVEEHSEQSVQEITVSSLIDVRRFLRPLLEDDLSNSVIELLRLMHNCIKENKLTGLATKLQECNTHLHSLRSLYHNVANRGEVTKDIVKGLLEDETATVSFNISESRKVNTMLKYKEDRVLNSNELSDCRSRALLLMSSESKEQDDDSDTEMKKFIEYVDSAMAIAGLYEQLVSSGYPEIVTSSLQRHQLPIREKVLRHTLSSWIKALEKAREKWYWLNHFYPEQITQIKLFLSEGSERDNIVSLFQCTGCSPVTLDSAQTLYAYISKSTETEDDEFGVNAVGATLDELMKRDIAIGPSFPADESFDPNKIRPHDRVQDGELYVINLNENSADVIPTLMTLYRNTTGHIPCHHQVLFCSENTSWESISLLLNRSVGGKRKGLLKQLYCIVNVEKLRNEEQFKLVYKLKELGSKIQYLAVICKGNANHPLINHFSENIHKLRQMQKRAMSKCIMKLWPDVNVVTSDLPGQGKTELIQCEAFHKNLDMASFHASGHVSEMSLITRLQQLSLNSDNLLHLDIGNLSNGEEADIIIFKLSILGFLSSGPHIFACPTQHVSIEIANSISRTLQNSLPTTQYFEHKHIRWQGFGNLRVSQEVNSPVQVVCHYLMELSQGTMDSSDVYFTGDNVVEPIPEDQCKELLKEQFDAVGDLSFSVLNILLNVLADQLKKMSCSLFLRTSSLVSMIGSNTVKSSLLKAILTVSTEFATRSVGTCRKEQMQALVSENKQKKTDLVKSREVKDVATAAAMTERVKGMIQWEQSNHFIITFHNQDIQTFSALYRDIEKVPEHVQNLFQTQMNKPLPDFSKVNDSDLKEKLQQIARFKAESLPEDKLEEINASYAMTPDNLLKMILIVMRIKSHIPVIIMGETGCGKTSLLRYLANICDIHFHVKNMHAGVEEEDVIECVQDAASFATDNIQEYVWLFLDEINTCDHMGLLNDLLCHHVFNGQNLPPNLSILAACNPYKLRKELNIFTAGLSSKVKTDEQSSLVYRVHPLPERMVDYVWDFGSLTDSDETAYVRSMVNKSLIHLEKELLVELLVMSQAFIRDVEKSLYCVSLRDVNRCRLLIPWFREEMLPAISSYYIDKYMKEAEAVIMALAHSYHSRLNQTSDREAYRENVAEILRKYHVASTYSFECNGDLVFRIIQKNQRAILEKMDLPDGIARNTALQENVFVIFVCLLKHIPIFVVGKPGCSKSLSLQLLKSNLRGKDSMDDYFKKLPQLYYVSFQGSESSTSDGILKVFDKAQNYRKHNKEDDVLPVVILDEIGLAEISTYNPLKVLHSLLEPENKEFPDVAVVGISNWALDAAKMNRAIHLSRPDMDEKELHTTAVSIAEASNETSTSISEMHRSDPMTLSLDDDSILKALAYAYAEYVHNQKIKNFHGLRDFYSLVKFISKRFRSQTSGSKVKCSFVLTGLLRNFGGLESEIKYVIETFNKHLEKLSSLQLLDMSDKPSLLTLIDENIKDINARHLMLVTRGDSSLSIVEDLLRSNGRHYMTILGSRFEEDQTDHYSYRILSKIILCMEQGITLILKDLETIYGSLYDMLNQNYTIVGKKKNCRIALGAYSNPLCQVADNFRCIVLVEEDKVDLSDPPFLNRFEKQKLVISDVLQPEMKELVVKLQALMEDISTVSGYESISPTELVPIYNSDMIPSLVHSQSNAVQKVSDNMEEIERECLKKIITLCTPEGMIRAEKSALVTKDINLMKSMKKQYFLMPMHEGLEMFITNLMPDCENGVAAMIFTHSNIYVNLHTVMAKFLPNSQFEKLGSFKSEKQLSSSIKKFWADTKHNWLFIQVSHTDQQHFLLMKSILEQERKQHLSSKDDVTEIKHVVVIIHVDRTTRGSQMGLVNFLSGWHMAMVDCLDSHTIPLKRLLDGTLPDLAKSLLQEKGISRQDLFGAFTCIHYTEMTRSMESITYLIDSIYENDVILRVLVELVQNWIGEMDSVTTRTDWQLEVACNTVKLKNFLTFYEALFEEVKSKLRHPLAAAVFTVERLNGWDYLSSRENHQLMNEKMMLWQSLLKNRHILDISGIAEPKGPECYPCKLTTLQTRFPFSSFFISNIEDLQKIFMDILRGKQLGTSDKKIDDATCESLYKLFRRSVNNVATELFEYNYGRAQFDDYFYDFCQWFTADMPLNMSEDQRIDVVSHAIKSRTVMEEEEFDMFVTKLHATGWIHKYQLQSEIILIDTCLSELKISLTDILTKTYTVKRETVIAKHLDKERVRNTITEDDQQDRILQQQHQNINMRPTRSRTTESVGEDTCVEASKERKISEDLTLSRHEGGCRLKARDTEGEYETSNSEINQTLGDNKDDFEDSEGRNIRETDVLVESRETETVGIDDDKEEDGERNHDIDTGTTSEAEDTGSENSALKRKTTRDFTPIGESKEAVDNSDVCGISERDIAINVDSDHEEHDFDNNNSEGTLRDKKDNNEDSEGRNICETDVLAESREIETIGEQPNKEVLNKTQRSDDDEEEDGERNQDIHTGTTSEAEDTGSENSALKRKTTRDFTPVGESKEAVDNSDVCGISERDIAINVDSDHEVDDFDNNNSEGTLTLQDKKDDTEDSEGRNICETDVLAESREIETIGEQPNTEVLNKTQRSDDDKEEDGEKNQDIDTGTTSEADDTGSEDSVLKRKTTRELSQIGENKDVDRSDVCSISERDIVITVDSQHDNEVDDFDTQASAQVRPEVIMSKAQEENDDDSSREDQLSSSDESSETSEENDDESECDDVVAASLVDQVCHFLIPSQEMKNKSVTEWQSMVNLVLSLTTDVSVQPVILETLRACNDLASMLVLPYEIDEKYFWEIGNILSKNSLDSEETLSIIKEFVTEISKHVPSHPIQHFISSYASCCLMANPETNLVSEMFEIDLISTRDINNVQFIGSVLHHAIFLQIENEPEELLEEGNLENDFFMMLGENLKRSQKMVDDSPFACVIVDLLQNHIFSQINGKLENDQQGFIGDILELKRKYTSEQSVTMKSLIIVGYLKVSLQCLASYVLMRAHKLTENLWQKINQVFEGSKLSISDKAQGLQAYFLKCLIKGGGLQACVDVKRKMPGHLEFLTSLDIASDKRLQSLEQNPLFLGCTKLYFEILKAAEGLCESNVTSLYEIFEQATFESEITYGLFALAMHEFFLIKAMRNMKENEEDLSKDLVKEARSKLPAHQVRLLSLLCQQEEFGIDFMQLQAPCTAKEYHMVSSVLDILATIFSCVRTVDCEEPKHIFLDCICDPLTAIKRPMPGLPDDPTEIHAYVWKVSPRRAASVYTFNCECACRLLFTEDCMLSVCLNCKRVTMKERFQPHYAVDMVDTDSESLSELMDVESGSIADATDLDSSTVPDEMEVDSVSIQDTCHTGRNISCMETVRHLTQVSFRIVQFIYLSCIAGGVALKYSSNIELQSIFHLDDKTDPSDYMLSQLSCQWECLKTLLSMGDEQLGRFLHVVFLKAKDILTNPNWHICTREERNEFEQELTQLVTPLVRRRFQLIMEQVRKFNEICRDEERYLEDVVCELYDEGKRTESLQHIWREVIQPSSENMKVEFLLTGSHELFPVLSLVFSYEKELKLMKHIWNLLQWHICTVKHISYRFKKKDCSKRTLSEFKHSIEGDENISKEVKLTLKEFTQSWEEITNMKHVIHQYIPDHDDVALYNIHPNIELEKCIIMNAESPIFRVLKALIRMQNHFLDDAMKLTLLQNVLSSSFLVRSNSCASVPVVKIEDITEHQVIKYPDFENLLKFSQCNTTCGHGREVVYDYYQIERDVSLQCLLKKAHIEVSDSFPKIAFAGEIQHTISTLLQEITNLLEQEPLSLETEQQLSRMDPSNRKVLMNYLEMTFCLLKRTSVSASDKKHVLGEFLESWQYLFPYRVQDVDSFCNNIFLCNIVFLYELVEKYMAADVIDDLKDTFRDPIPPEAQIWLTRNNFDEIDFLEALVTALSKFAYRYLQSSDVDPEEQLSVQLKEPSLWPKGIVLKVTEVHREGSLIEEFDLLPSVICVKHIFKTVKHFKAQIEQLREKSRVEPVQQKKKVTKAKKSKQWKR